MSARLRLLAVTALLGGLAALLVYLRLQGPGGVSWSLPSLFREKEAAPAVAPAVVEEPAPVEPTPDAAPVETWSLSFAWERAVVLDGNGGEPFAVGEAAARDLLGGELEVAVADDLSVKSWRRVPVQALREEAAAAGEALALSVFVLPLSGPDDRSVLVTCSPCPAGKNVLPTVLRRLENGVDSTSSTLLGRGPHVVRHAGDLNGDGLPDVVVATAGGAADGGAFVLWAREGVVRFADLGNGARLWRDGERTILEGRDWAARPDLGSERPAWPSLLEWDGQTFADRSPSHRDFFRLHYVPAQEQALAAWNGRTDADERTRSRWIAVHLGLLERARAFLEGRPLAPLESLDPAQEAAPEATDPEPRPTPEPDPSTGSDPASQDRTPPELTETPTPRPTQARWPTPRADRYTASSCGVVVSTPVLTAWRTWERSNGSLGCPSGGERDAARSPFGTTGRFLDFPVAPGLPHGAAISRPTDGSRGGAAFVTVGPIHGAWMKMGGTASKLGFPLSDEYAVPGGRRLDFEGGAIVLEASRSWPRTLHPKRYLQDDDSRDPKAPSRFLHDYDLLEQGRAADWVHLRDFDARRYRTVAVKPYRSEGARSEAGRLAEQGKRALEAAISRATGLDAWTVVDGPSADLVLEGHVAQVWGHDGYAGTWVQGSVVQELLGRDRSGQVVFQMRHRSVGRSLRKLLSRGVGDFVEELEGRQQSWRAGR